MKMDLLTPVIAFKHFKTVMTHKMYVFLFCKEAGIPWQGIKHDLSKFSPTEFIESVKYYTGTDSPINNCKKVNGYSEAWMHHKGRNKHHYEFWQDDFDHGGKALQMPFKYALELICDYLAAGRTYMGNAFTYEGEYKWWLNKFDNKGKPNYKLAMHPQTVLFVDTMLQELKNGNMNVLKKENAKKIYNRSTRAYKNILKVEQENKMDKLRKVN